MLIVMQSLKKFIDKMSGLGPPAPGAGLSEIAFASLGGGLALLIICLLHEYSFGNGGLPILMAPFGASAMLVFGTPRSAFAQPRNVVFGHTFSALVGVTCHFFIGEPIIAICLAVAFAIAVMYLGNVVHPPGGATALLTAWADNGIGTLGYWYVLAPCFTGSIIMILVALVINNIPAKSRYPQFW